ncbi:MAG: hypothetical protein ACKO96_44805 [Flammeovirgaceae bacterium]
MPVPHMPKRIQSTGIRVFKSGLNAAHVHNNGLLQVGRIVRHRGVQFFIIIIMWERV